MSAFRAPGAEDVGELQVSISERAEVEHVSAIRAVEELPREPAIFRRIGRVDPAVRGRNFLQEPDSGTTFLEHGDYFTLPAGAAAQPVRTAPQAAAGSTSNG